MSSLSVKPWKAKELKAKWEMFCLWIGFSAACSSWNRLYREKEKGRDMTLKFAQVTQTSSCPSVQQEGLTRPIFHCMLYPGENKILSFLALPPDVDQLKTLIGFDVFVSWLVNDFFKNVSPPLAAPVLLNALSPGTARLWWCWLHLVLLWAHLVVQWQNHHFIYVVTFFHSGWGRKVGGCAEFHQEGDFIPWNRGCRCCAGVWVRSAGFDTCRMVWGTSRFCEALFCQRPQD